MTIERSSQTGPYAEGWNTRFDAKEPKPKSDNPYDKLSSERVTWGAAWSDCDWHIRCGRGPKPDDDDLTPDVNPVATPEPR